MTTKRKLAKKDSQRIKCVKRGTVSGIPGIRKVSRSFITVWPITRIRAET